MNSSDAQTHDSTLTFTLALTFSRPLPSLHSAVEIYNEDAKKVVSSPLQKSETRGIHPVKVNYSEVGSTLEGSVVLCDTPGYVITTVDPMLVLDAFTITLLSQLRSFPCCYSLTPFS